MPELSSRSAEWIGDVLGFWFTRLDRKAWFVRSAETDELIRSRYLALHESIAVDVPPEIGRDPRAALATVIVLDQFPRNMFRDSPRAFATDPLALDVARHAVEAGLDVRLHGVAERLFLYLPFEHSEDLPDQDRAVALIAALGDDEYARYAVAHREIIARFGRFPHRNAVLGRQSSEAELAFLQLPGSAF